MSCILKSLWHKTREGFSSHLRAYWGRIGEEPSLELGKCRKVSSRTLSPSVFPCFLTLKCRSPSLVTQILTLLFQPVLPTEILEFLHSYSAPPDTHWSFSPQPPSIPLSCPRIHAWRHRARPEGQTALRWQSGLAEITTAFQCWPLSLNQTAASWSLLPFGWPPPPLPTQSLSECPQWCPHKLSYCFSPTVSTD